ncbi:MAG: glycine cleavage system protein H [Proteobacteria bacterium]|nr:glycine cleavage system protein H [Pseudomonadota bacterium]
MDSIRTKKQSSGAKAECIWSQAGATGYLACDDDYHCESCDTDGQLRKAAVANRKLKAEGIRPTGKHAGVVFWKEKLKERPLGKQFCLHHMKGRIDLKTCTNDYNCINCDFDQYFHDQYSVHAVIKPIDVLDIGGFKMPQGYYYHRGHTWAKVEENSEVRIGIDDFALRLLGPPDRIEAPLIGKEVKQGRGEIVLAREGNRVALLSPVSGVVTAVNHGLRERGRLANASPYVDGWVLRVHATDLRRDLKNLVMGSEKRELLDREIEQLYRLIEEADQPLAADGGDLVDDIYGAMPGLGWDSLITRFLLDSDSG